MGRLMNKAIYIIYASTLLLGACNTDDVALSGREEIEVNVSVDTPTQTRVNEAGNAFEDKDEFILYMNERPSTDGGITKADYTYNATANKWNTSNPLYWDDRAGAIFCAVSPIPAADGADGYVIGAGGNDTYSVQQDQTDLVDYKKSDLLIARSQATGRLLDVKFKHAFCKVVVKITSVTTGAGAFTLEDFKDAVVTLSQKQVKGEIEYPTETEKAETVIATGTGDAKDITMRKMGAPTTLDALEYAAIIPQQDVTLDGSTLLVTLANVGVAKNTYTYKPELNDLKPNDTSAFTQGKQTTITIKLTKTGVELDATGEIKIVPWATGPTGTDDDAIVLPKN